jgi:excisionase family DNA binding protein
MTHEDEDAEGRTIDLEKVREGDRLARKAAEGDARPLPPIDELEAQHRNGDTMDLRDRQTFRVDEAAELLDIHPETVRRWIRADDLQASELGNGYRISRADLEAVYQHKGGGALFAETARAQLRGRLASLTNVVRHLAHGETDKALSLLEHLPGERATLNEQGRSDEE